MKTCRAPVTQSLLGALLALTLSGCNILTGVQDFSLDAADGGGGATGGPGGGGADAAGGAPGAGGDDGPPGSGASSGVGGSGGGGSTTTGPGMECVYPTGPYGTSAGATLDPAMSWQAFPENGSSMQSVSVLDLFDCDGSKGTSAVLFIVAQISCQPCQMEADEVGGLLAGWSAQGIRVVTLMVPGGASQWREAFGLESSIVADDPAGSMLADGGNGTPINIVWDPRTGQVVERWNGYGAGYGTLEALANQNAN